MALERMSWTERKTNDEVLTAVGEKRRWKELSKQKSHGLNMCCVEMVC